MARVLIFAFTVLLLGVLAAVLLSGDPGSKVMPHTRPTTQAVVDPFYIALVPEYDVFTLRKNHRALMDYLSPRIGRKIEIVTLNNYEAVLKEFSAKRIDAAFLGSLVATLAMDRCEARPLARPERQGTGTYHGVLFVRDDSPIRSLDDLGAGKIAMIKTTTAGSLFPLAELHRLGHQPTQLDDPRLMWLGTYDDIIMAVMMTKDADVGAVKNLRLEAFQKGHSAAKLRVLSRSQVVPNSALLVGADVDKELAAKLQAALLGMKSDPEAKPALTALGIDGFIPTSLREYGAVFDLIDAAGEAWELVGVSGPPPRRMAGKGTE